MYHSVDSAQYVVSIDLSHICVDELDCHVSITLGRGLEGAV